MVLLRGYKIWARNGSKYVNNHRQANIAFPSNTALL